MIKINKGDVKISGTRTTVMAEFGVLVDTLLYDLKLANPEMLHALINFAVESREE